MNPVIRGLWSLYAKSYDGLLSFWPYQHLLDLMAERINPLPGQVIVDLGCGTGNLLRQVEAAQPEAVYVGIDVSPGMLKVAHRKLAPAITAGRLSLSEGELMAFLTAQPTASVDLFASMNVLYTIGDQTALWREIMRVLKPTGSAIITTSIRPGSGPIIREHFQHAGLLPLLRPRLLAVFIIDALINALGHTGHFAFSDEAALEAAITAAGGSMTNRIHCYGGDVDGVNLLFSVNQA